MEIYNPLNSTETLSPNTSKCLHMPQQLHQQVPVHAMNKNTCVVWLMHKTLYGVHPHLFLNHYFCTLLITLFTIALIKYFGPQYPTFYLLIFFKVTSGFPCTCYLLKTLKHSSNHTTYKALSVSFLCLCNIQQTLKLCVSVLLSHYVFLNLCLTPSSVVINYKKSNRFYLLH